MSFAATVESAPARLAPLNSFSGASLPPLSTGHVGMPTNIDERLVVRNASVIAPLFAPPPEAYVTAPLRRPCVVERTELSLPETQTSIASDILNRGKRATRHYTKKTLGALPLFCTLASERAGRPPPSLSPPSAHRSSSTLLRCRRLCRHICATRARARRAERL